MRITKDDSITHQSLLRKSVNASSHTSHSSPSVTFKDAGGVSFGIQGYPSARRPRSCITDILIALSAESAWAGGNLSGWA